MIVIAVATLVGVVVTHGTAKGETTTRSYKSTAGGPAVHRLQQPTTLTYKTGPGGHVIRGQGTRD
jgi:hypothetical protein